MDSISIDTAILLVARHFAQELQKLRSKTDRQGSWSSDRIELQVRVGDKVDFSVEYNGPSGTVKASKLGPLMDEVYRRAGFDDRQAANLQREGDALQALPGPDSWKSTLDDEIKF